MASMIEPSLGQQTYQAKHIVSTRHTLLKTHTLTHTHTHKCILETHVHVCVPWVSLQMNDSSKRSQHCSSNALHSTRQYSIHNLYILVAKNTAYLYLHTYILALYIMHVHMSVYVHTIIMYNTECIVYMNNQRTTSPL